MNKLKDLSLAAIIVLVIAFMAMMYFMYDDTQRDALYQLDQNGDGVVSRAELKHYLQLARQPTYQKQKIRSAEITRSMLMGAFRGLLMGLVLKDLEGGFALAFVSGLMNPVMVGAERYIL